MVFCTPGQKKPLPNLNRKSILLLQLITGYSDKQALKTYQYYWNKYPDVWKSTLFVNTNIDMNDPNKILLTTTEINNNQIMIQSYYYNLGYRLFIGFTTSGNLNGLLPWFNEHPEALGISLTSSSTALAIPKPVYRLQPTDSTILEPLLSIANDAPQILYVYSNGQNASEALKTLLEQSYEGKIFFYPVEDDSSNINETDISTFYSSIPGLGPTAITIIYLYVGTQQEDYVNLYSADFPMPNNNYDITVNPTNIHENTKLGIVDKYFTLYFYSLSTSAMFRKGIEDLNINFGSAVPNALILENFLLNYGNSQIDTISSQNAILEFDENNDLKYYNIITYKYSYIDSVYSFAKFSVYINNPLATFKVLLLP